MRWSRERFAGKNAERPGVTAFWPFRRERSPSAVQATRSEASSAEGMSLSSPQPESAAERRMVWAAAFLALAILPFMITSESLWIDEGDTAFLAVQPDLRAWTRTLLTIRISDAQMPLYMLTTWLWSRVAGMSEWALRSQNLVWAALAIWAAAQVGRRWRMPLLPLFLALHPFFWQYVNEARPYACQIAGGAWLLAGFVEFLERRAEGVRWAGIVAAASILLTASHMLGIIPVGVAAATIALLCRRRGWSVAPAARRVFAVSGGVLALLAAYYAWTLARGVHGARLWNVGMANVLFSGYELLGFGGLGLPRHAMREMAETGGVPAVMAALRPYAFGMAALAVVYAGILLNAWRNRSRIHVSRLGPLLFFPLISVAVLLAAAVPARFPFWGRHLAFVLPWLVAAVALLAAAAPSSRRRWPFEGFWPFAVLAIFLAASLNQRFDPAYGRDDYRSASRVARAWLARDRVVWWAASEWTANYYGIVSSPGSGGNVVFLHAPSAQDLARRPRPDLIVLSKPSIHDPSGAIAAFIRQQRYVLSRRYIGFTIWQAAPGRRGGME